MGGSYGCNDTKSPHIISDRSKPVYNNSALIKTTQSKSRRNAFINKISPETKTESKLDLDELSFLQKNNEFNYVTKLCYCGEYCIEEDWMTQTNPFIVGLNSSKITNNLIASQRPSTCLIKHYSLIKQFK